MPLAMQPKLQAGVGSVGPDGRVSTSAWAIGPTARVLDTATMPISDKIGGCVVPDRTPTKRLAEQLTMTASRQNHFSRK